MTPAETAHEWLMARPLFLDTETTGLDFPEACEIAVVDTDGAVLLNSLVRPKSTIERGAQMVHGITPAMVADAPTFDLLWPKLNVLLADRLVVIYNANFDLDVIANSQSARGVVAGRACINGVCAMKLYALFHGEWNDYRQSYRWQKLNRAIAQCGITLPDLHRALADAEACRRLVHYMAAQGVRQP